MTRKFLLYSEKEKYTILFTLFSRTLLDIEKIQNDNINIQTIIDFMFKKSKSYSILKDEIESLLNNNINNIDILIKSYSMKKDC